MSDNMQYARVYPDDAIAANRDRLDVIDPQGFGSLPALTAERISRSPDAAAYLEFAGGTWHTTSWREFGEHLTTWRKAFAREQLGFGDRVAIRLRNCMDWVLFDQAAMGAGLVVVPVYAEDRADNICYIADQTTSRVFLVEKAAEWEEICDDGRTLDHVQRVVIVTGDAGENWSDSRLISLSDWLAAGAVATDPLDDAAAYLETEQGADTLATIVYTSGTTGKPKGVMLSHRNMMQNAYDGLRSVAVFPDDRMLSFLPLSHMFERTIGCYLSIVAGSSVAFNRSIPELIEDMGMVKPTIIITVPRIFERAYDRIREQLDEGSAVKRWLFEKAVALGWEKFEASQGRGQTGAGQIFQPLLDKLVGNKVRGRFGGNLRFVISGGAPLAPRISKVFIGLGVDILQGYGLTESSPVLSVNTLRNNLPESIGLPLLGTEIRLNEDSELQAKGPGIMLGYFQNEEATRETMTDDGWLRSGDIATISDDGFISITGRIKEIIVLANGEKVPPSDMEAAICDHSVFDQAMVVGEGKGYLSAIVVLNPDAWKRAAGTAGFNSEDLDDENARKWAVEEIARQVEDFPGYANIYAVTLTLDPWTVEDGDLTPTMKLKRPVIRDAFKDQIEAMYR